MKNESLIKIAATTVLILSVLAGGCSSGPVTEQQVVASVQRGDMAVTARSDGNIEMPNAVNLYFDTTTFTASFSSRIQEIYVKKGDLVHAGALLAKLDDTGQKLTVENSQYALESAINNVVQQTCCGAGRFPTFYADSVALLRYEYAIKEMTAAKEFLSTNEFEEAAEQITLAKSDIDGTQSYYTNPDYKQLRIQYNDLDQAVESSQDFATAIDRLGSELDIISGLQQQLTAGQYASVIDSIDDLLTKMSDTHTVVKRITHLPDNGMFPDTATAYTVVSELESSMDTLRELANAKEFDQVEFSERLSMARHDLELSTKILEQNMSSNRLGLNEKTLRDYNIAIQNAVINLERSKEALLKTELIAPFDGRVVDVNLQAGDMITQRYAVTGAPIDSYVIRLVNTGNVRMAGLVDEIDVVKIKEGQPADVTVDALPGKVLKGTVSFISPYGSTEARGIQYYGTLQSTLATYRLEITLDPEDAAYLAGGQTAEADLQVDKHTNVLSVPNSAVMGKTGSYYVRVLVDEKNNLIEQRPVQIGLQNESNTEIVSGLSEGEKVILQKSSAPARSVKK
jgi:RND family efflux transporter MFP subunit